MHVTIIYVENDPTARSITKKFLETQGFKVWSVATFMKALEITQAHEINIALIDMRLSNDQDAYDESGLALAKQLRKENLVRSIIMVTGDEDLEKATTALRTPPIADDYVLKRKGLGYLLASIIRQLAIIEVPRLNGSVSNKLINTGLPFELSRDIQDILKQCYFFESYENLLSIFIDERIVSWKHLIPQVPTVEQRVRFTISRFLHLPISNKNGLMLLLEVILDHLPNQAYIQQKQQLQDIIERLRRIS